MTKISVEMLRGKKEQLRTFSVKTFKWPEKKKKKLFVKLNFGGL